MRGGRGNGCMPRKYQDKLTNTLIPVGSHALIINHKLEKPAKVIKNCCLFKYNKTKVDCHQNFSMVLDLDSKLLFSPELIG